MLTVYQMEQALYWYGAVFTEVLSVSDDVEQKPEEPRAFRPSQVTRGEGQFADEKKQGDWMKATEDHRASKKDSATMEALTEEKIAEIQDNGGWNKFQITGLDEGSGTGCAEETGTVIDYQPQERVKDTKRRDTRSVYQKLTDFAQAAEKRAADPEGWRTYIQGTKSGEAALKIADGVATRVDETVMQVIQHSIKAAEDAAKASPEVEQAMKQMLQNYLREKGLTGPELILG